MEMKKERPNTTHLSLMREKKIRDLMTDKRRLVEVPYTASLAHTMNTLVANGVLAVPVAAPPGHWIGAGGSMILESDKNTGAVRKHYIGMVTMLDILLHIAEANDQNQYGKDLDHQMSVPVSTIIGNCLEGLSLWTLNPNTSVLDCIEVFSKGIHRALVPLDSHMDQVVGVEIAESSSGYRMLTQMDVLKFLKAHGTELKDLMSSTVGELGVINENVYGVTGPTKVIEAIKSMRTASLSAVPILEASASLGEDHMLVNGKGMRPIGTFSASDLKGCPIALLQSWLSLSVEDFTERVAMGPKAESNPLVVSSPRVLVSCNFETSLGEVIDKVLAGHVHRVWVVDQQGLLVGLVSLTDILRVMRAATES
ncbi:cystathionine beta-synthase (CBS) protein [Tasmannia lanceolata]|uniref:cystathionine beta-synthase (CBS) protein n=1 Tax=Tasmannia lanceolata TaxID=3420 RepID=UPI004063E195